MTPGTELIFFILLVAGGLAYVWGLLAWRKKMALDDFAASSPSAAAMGPIKLSGTARADELQRTPFSDLPCCWWSCEIQEGYDRNWKTIALRQSKPLLYLEDSAGSVRIDPSGAELYVSPHIVTLSKKHYPTLGNWGIPFFNAEGLRSLRAVEKIIPEGSLVYVRGKLDLTTKRGSHDPQPLIAVSSDGPFMISTTPYERLSRKLKGTALLALMYGIASLSLVAQWITAVSFPVAYTLMLCLLALLASLLILKRYAP